MNGFICKKCGQISYIDKIGDTEIACPNCGRNFNIKMQFTICMNCFNQYLSISDEEVCPKCFERNYKYKAKSMV